MTFLEQQVRKFVNAHRTSDQPLVLGLSGGPDSTALLHLLAGRLPLAALHIDHGWRSESGEEAAELRARCEALQIPFYCRKIEPMEAGGNREELAREARFAFFRECADELQAEALVLGHHADDQAETVLKRLLEGAPIAKQSGIRPVSTQGKLTIWRPLLSIPKKKILSWLDSKHLPYFVDRSNFDGSNLRSKFRTQMIPQLLGKEIAAPLSRHAEEATELREYLDRKVSPLVEQWESEERVELGGRESIEVKHFIRSIGCLSTQQVRLLAEALIECRPFVRHGSFAAKKGFLTRERGKLSIKSDCMV